MMRSIHERDGYPAFPTDFLEYLVSPDAYEAWVAERAGRIVGHVALHRRTSDPVLALASHALRQPVERLGVVARLFVGPTARRSGAGRALLDVASDEAVARGLWPILDVATHFHAAVGLYEQCGWTRLGELTIRFGEGEVLDEYVYLGPDSPERTA